MAVYVIEFFIQGRGWVGQEELGIRGGHASREDAEDFAARVIEEMMGRADHPYGSRRGDIVGFRVIESMGSEEAEPRPAPAGFRFSDVRHRYFKRGEAYMLYKYWSWPD